MIEDRNKKADALRVLGQAFAEASLWKQAEDTIHAIEVLDTRSIALTELSWILIEKQLWEQARAIWQQADQAHYEVLSSQHEVAIAKYRTLLSTVLMQVEQWDAAAEVLGEIPRSGLRGDVELTRLFCRTLANAQQWDRAETFIASTTSSYYQVVMLIDLGQYLMDVQEVEQAHEVWSRAWFLIPRLEHAALWRPSLLLNLFRAYVSTQQWECIHKSISILVDSVGSNLPGVPLVELCEMLSDAHQWESADYVFSLIEAPLFRAKALIAMGRAFMGAKQWEKARIVWGNALDIFVALLPQSPPQHILFWEQLEELLQLGQASMGAGMSEEAVSAWSIVEIMLRPLPDTDRKESICAL